MSKMFFLLLFVAFKSIFLLLVFDLMMICPLKIYHTLNMNENLCEYLTREREFVTLNVRDGNAS